MSVDAGFRYIMMGLRLELSHCLYGMLDRGFEIEAVAVIQIDGLDTEPLQALCACFFGVFGVATEIILLMGAHAGELGSEEDLVALPCTSEPFSDQVFAVALLWMLVISKVSE